MRVCYRYFGMPSSSSVSPPQSLKPGFQTRSAGRRLVPPLFLRARAAFDNSSVRPEGLWLELQGSHAMQRGDEPVQPVAAAYTFASLVAVV